MKINTPIRVWQTIAAINGTGAVIVTCATFLVYPRGEWVFQLVYSLSLTVCIATPIAWFMANRLMETNLLRAQLQRMVDRDRLTGMASRDYFFRHMEKTPDAGGVVLMVDIDHFKRVNDTHGHFAGDRVLKHVAALMQDIVRDDDIVARFGGEEFLVFLLDADTQTGLRVAERMREQIAARPIRFEEKQIEVSVSVGGVLKTPSGTLQQALKDADAALYRAKDAGRNRTVFAGGDGEGDDLVAA